MNNTDKFFIQCLSDHINNRITETPVDDIDLDYLYQLSVNHEVAGIIYYQLRRTEMDSQRYLKSYSSSLYHYMNREKCLEEVKSRFKNLGIDFALVKGAQIAALYPVPELRTMGDIDVLIHEDDKERVHCLMTELGYCCTSRKSTGDWDYRKQAVEFEMHPQLIYQDEEVEKKEFVRFFNDFWPYVGENNELKPEFHLLYLLVHLRKHLLNHGAGMRQFMDVAVFTKAYSEQLDWSWIKDKLDVLSLNTFAGTVYSFVFGWFNITSPLETIEITEEEYLENTDIILQNGVFGFHSAEDEKSLISYAAAKEGKIGIIKYYIGMIFPNLGFMRAMKGYSFLNGRPWLLPVAWIIRIFKIITSGRTLQKLASIETTPSADKVNMIKKWGII